MGDLSAEQISLVRHALGLTHRKRSYRNRYFCTPDGTSYAEWMQMVASGHARTDGSDESNERLTLFWLTRRGAEAALMPGEKLCQEDFPPPLPDVDRRFLEALAAEPGGHASADRLYQFQNYDGNQAKRRCTRAGLAKYHRVGRGWAITPAGLTAIQETGNDR